MKIKTIYISTYICNYAYWNCLKIRTLFRGLFGFIFKSDIEFRKLYYMFLIVSHLPFRNIFLKIQTQAVCLSTWRIPMTGENDVSPRLCSMLLMKNETVSWIRTSSNASKDSWTPCWSLWIDQKKLLNKNIRLTNCFSPFSFYKAVHSCP